ncbi:MAG: outer membrane lipoprotein-sorting protein [Deltaproteobacteria bacterium]|nr:outer membrane lipoprotein-sorting protein [Deltaproteobacteria bacterium]
MISLLFALSVSMTPDDMLKMLKALDERERAAGDYKSLVYLEQKEKDKPDVAREALVYRRSADQKFVILFTKPKDEQGKGYLRLDKNLWFYDPNTGKWERRTERERLNGTDSRRTDLDESHLADEYDPSFEGDDTLGKFKVKKLTLKVKPGVDVAYPVVKLWIDENNNILKRQEFALSGRAMRTLYYPRWNKQFSETKKAEVWFPGEIRIYDEVEKANSTIVVIKTVDLRPLEPNLFTKSWLESKSR